MNTTASPVLDMDGFIRTLVHNITSALGPDVEISTSEQRKNNQVTYPCLTIRHRDRKISPNIRIDELFDTYQKGQMDIPEITEKISEAYESISRDATDFEVICSDSEKATEKIFFRLINYERNSEVLETYPHFRFLDLAVIFCLNVSLPNGESGAVRIDNKTASALGFDAEKLLSLALNNTPSLFPSDFESLDDILIGLMKKKGVPEYMIPLFPGEENLHSPMKVLSNKQQYYGAACILYPGVLESVKSEIGGDFYIIPSSVNEVIIVPDDVSDRAKLVEMVRDVNSTVIPPEQILSDNIYHYPADFGSDVIGPLLASAGT
ncbi:MAG: DUF5688 family protein [Lachnospiraceae bacterium]|nr:DUF5688 family protein [Lachnospiraceae bacterium]